MTEEQIEKEAENYIDALYFGKSLAEADREYAIKDWKAGYHFRDKEVEELKSLLRDILRYDYDHLSKSGVSALTAELSERIKKVAPLVP